MFEKLTQADHVAEDQEGSYSNEKSITEKVNFPGMETLYKRPAKEIGEVLANLIKSKAGLTKITYDIKEGIELTYRP